LTLIPVMTAVVGRLEFWMRVDPFSPPTAFVVQYDDGKNRRAVWGNKADVGGSADVDMGPLPAPGEWVHMTVPFEKLGSKPGARLKNLVLMENGGEVCLDVVSVAGQAESSNDPLSSFGRWWALCKGTNPA